MSKSSLQKSTNPDYEVGYGRPPVATQFAPKTSGNPRGRPPKARAKGHEKPDAASGLSAIHRAVLDVGAAKVEVRRGGRKVMMTQIKAAAEGVAVMAREGSVAAARLFFGLHSEAEAEADALRQSAEAIDYRESALRIAAGLRAAKRDGPEPAELEPPLAGIDGVGADEEDQMRPGEPPQALGEWSDGQRDAPPDSECVGATLPEPLPAPRDKPIMREVPQTAKAPSRSGEPLIADRRPIRAVGWGING